MANELKPWKYDIQYGPEGEANYAWVYDDHGVMVATMKTHKAKEIVDRMNTRPAAPVEGLDTVETQWRCTFIPNDKWVSSRHPENMREGAIDTRELVSRSQAEAIIAVKDEIIDTHRKAQVILGKQLNEVIADNAALTARVKEVEADKALWEATAKEIRKQAKALETQLAAARKALEDIAALSSLDMPLGDQVFAVTSARAALKVIP